MFLFNYKVAENGMSKVWSTKIYFVLDQLEEGGKKRVNKKNLGTEKKYAFETPSPNDAKTKEKQREQRADTQRRDRFDANTLTPENATVLM